MLGLNMHPLLLISCLSNCEPLYWWSNLQWDCTAVSWVLCVLITIYSSEAIQLLPFSRVVVPGQCFTVPVTALILRQERVPLWQTSNVKPHAQRRSVIYYCSSVLNVVLTSGREATCMCVKVDMQFLSLCLFILCRVMINDSKCVRALNWQILIWFQ